MANKEVLIFLTAVVGGFSLLIYVSLRFRKLFLKKNLEILAEQIWQNVSQQSFSSHFAKTDLLFAIRQDGTNGQDMLVIKDSMDAVVGRVLRPMASREHSVWIYEQEYKIKFVNSGWLKAANFYSVSNDSILASFKVLNIFGEHKFEISNYGQIISQRQGFSFHYIFNYYKLNQMIGTTRLISARMQVGRLGVLPQDIPLPVRVFILSV